MIIEYVSKVAYWIFAIIGLLVGMEGTWLDKALRFLYFGPLLDWVILWNDYLFTLLVVIFVSRWIKDWRWLLAILVLAFVFFKFVW